MGRDLRELYGSAAYRSQSWFSVSSEGSGGQGVIEPVDNGLCQWDSDIRKVTL